MAEGWAREHARELGLNVEIASAGTRPEGYVHPTAITVMNEKGVDISHQHSKGVRREELLKFDYVITLGCSGRDICPAGFRGDARDWGIDDPFGKPLEFYRKMRDEIAGKVVHLLQELAPTGYSGASAQRASVP